MAEPSSGSEWLRGGARAGYVTKGVVHLALGILTLMLAFGEHDAESTDTQGAIRMLASQPFGTVLLVLIAAGLTLYALWRLLDAALDLEARGRDAKAILARVGLVFGGLAYLGLAFYAASRAFGWQLGGSGDEARDESTAWLMSQPFGAWLVGLLGLVLIVIAGFRAKFGLSAEFLDDYRKGDLVGAHWRFAGWLGRIGICARALAFGLIGVFLVIAAVQRDPDEARGLGQALATLALQPFGAWALGAVGVGFLAYGLHCMYEARLRRLSRG